MELNKHWNVSQRECDDDNNDKNNAAIRSAAF